MQFVYELVPNGKNKIVRIEHKGEVLEFPIEKYRKFISDELVFGDINRALRKLEDDVQDELFGIYRTINEDFLIISSVQKLTQELMMNLKRISELVPYDLVDEQVKRDNNFWIPPDPKELTPANEVMLSSFSQDNQDDEEESEESESTKRQQAVEFINRLTYTLQDYEDLNTLIIYIKLYLPILSKYNILVKDDIDEFYRYIATMELLTDTEMVKREGWLRLHVYVRHFWAGRKKKEELNPATLMKGISDENVVEWVIAKLVFYRLIPIGVSHTDQDIPDKDRPNFIKGLFHNVESYVNSLTSNPKNERYENKDTSSFDHEDGEPSSKLEMLRVVEEIEGAAIVRMNVFLSNLDYILPHMDERLTAEMVEDTPYRQTHHRSLNAVRRAIISWIMYRGTPKNGKINPILMSPEFIDYIDDKAYRNVYRVVAATLKLWGFDQLLEIFESRIVPNQPRETIFNLLPISIEQLKALKEYYPHEIEKNRVKGESKRDASYVITLLSEIQHDVSGVVTEHFAENHRFVCQSDVQFLLAELILFMHRNHHLK